LIKYGPRLNDKLRKLYIDQINNAATQENEGVFSKIRGVPSAVQISAIISSYSRTSVNILKNIPGNLAIASNTDSLILKNPLPDNLIGSELGQ
jgi:hypothetical protein